MYHLVMRTTLSIDEDVLSAAKEMAVLQKKTVGEVISALARDGMQRESAGATRNGILLLPFRPDARPVTLDLVNKLRDELPG